MPLWLSYYPGERVCPRFGMVSWTPDTKPTEDEFIYRQLEWVRAGQLPESAFNDIFEAWVRERYRLKLEEILADSVAALMLNPKYAFEVHGTEGKQYLSKLYTRLYRHLENKYQLSLGRPKEEVRK